MTSLLDLPNELILCILEHLPVEKEEIYWAAHALYSSCSHFSWLKEYRFGLLWATEYDVIYSTLDINGKHDGPEYRFSYYDRSLSGVIFYKSDRIVGDSCYVEMPASNIVEYVINEESYREDIVGCVYDAELEEIYKKIQEIDSKTLQYIHRNYNKRRYCRIMHADAIVEHHGPFSGFANMDDAIYNQAKKENAGLFSYYYSEVDDEVDI